MTTLSPRALCIYMTHPSAEFLHFSTAYTPSVGIIGRRYTWGLASGIDLWRYCKIAWVFWRSKAKVYTMRIQNMNRMKNLLPRCFALDFDFYFVGQKRDWQPKRPLVNIPWVHNFAHLYLFGYIYMDINENIWEGQ